MSERLLLDTHVAIWWWAEPSKLSTRCRKSLSKSNSTVFVSAATPWEVATKVRLGKLDFPADILENFEQEVVIEGWRMLPISGRHARTAGGMDWAHRDPFDRMLAAQAELESLVLVSKDPAFRSRTQLSCLW